jgi:hypothetical protein
LFGWLIPACIDLFPLTKYYSFYQSRTIHSTSRTTLVEEFTWPLELGAGCGFGRGTTLVMTARVLTAFFWLFSQVAVVQCLVVCVVCVWWRSLRRVMYNYLFFLNNTTVLLSLIFFFKKMPLLVRNGKPW